MPYVIIAKDKPNSEDLRNEVRAVHLDYLSQNAEKLMAAGATLDDDGTGADGSVLIVDTEDRAEAEAFAANDPFSKAGLFETVTVRRWRKAFFDKQRFV